MKKLLFFVILLISVVRLDAQNNGDQITIDSLIYKVTSISPAECEVYRYTDSITDITIYVPESSVESYKVTTPWNYYEIIGFSPTFVSEVHNEDLNIYPNSVNDRLYIETEGVIAEIISWK